MIQPSHLALIGLQYAVGKQVSQYHNGTMRLVDEFIARYFHYRLTAQFAVERSPAAHLQETGKHFVLLLRAAEHVGGDSQSARRTELRGKRNAGLGLRPVSVSRLKSARQCRIEHVAEGRHVVRRYPSPKLQLTVGHYGGVVHHHLYVLDGKRGLVGMSLDDERDVGFRTPERHERPVSRLDFILHGGRNGIGEKAVKRQRKDYVYIHDMFLCLGKRHFKTTNAMRRMCGTRADMPLAGHS